MKKTDDGAARHKKKITEGAKGCNEGRRWAWRRIGLDRNGWSSLETHYKRSWKKTRLEGRWGVREEVGAYLESSSSSLVEVEAAEGFLLLLTTPPPSSESSSELSYSSVDTSLWEDRMESNMRNASRWGAWPPACDLPTNLKSSINATVFLTELPISVKTKYEMSNLLKILTLNKLLEGLNLFLMANKLLEGLKLQCY